MAKLRDNSLSLDQRDSTRLRVLDHIRGAQAVSRIDIAKAIEASPATLTSVTADLLSAGLIEEIETPRGDGTKRGRPRVCLKLNGASNYVAGLKVARHVITVQIVDFEGHEIASHQADLHHVRMEPEDFVLTIRAAIEAGCAKGNLALSDLSGIAIGIAGFVKAQENFVHWSSSIVGRNVELGPYLDKHLPCPAFIENDANLVAKAEQVFGEGRGLKNFLVVTVEHGVGLGIVLNGKLYRGERGCGSEFGHMKVQLDGALCQCGQRGCLEAYVGDYALIREATIANPDTDPSSVSKILQDAEDGNPLAMAVLDRAGQMFGMGLSNLINLFDPERIIVAGARMGIEHLHSDKVMDRVRRGVISVDAPLPDIRITQWGDMMWAKGAAAYGLEQVSIIKVKELGDHEA